MNNASKRERERERVEILSLVALSRASMLQHSPNPFRRGATGRVCGHTDREAFNKPMSQDQAARFEQSQHRARHHLVWDCRR